MCAPSRDAPRSDAAIVAIIITPQSPVHIQLPPLVFVVAKSRYRRVIRKAKVSGPWLLSFQCQTSQQVALPSERRTLGLSLRRDMGRPHACRSLELIPPETLGCLCLSRSLGYREL